MLLLLQHPLASSPVAVAWRFDRGVHFAGIGVHFVNQADCNRSVREEEEDHHRSQHLEEKHAENSQVVKNDVVTRECVLMLYCFPREVVGNWVCCIVFQGRLSEIG